MQYFRINYIGNLLWELILKIRILCPRQLEVSKMLKRIVKHLRMSLWILNNVFKENVISADKKPSFMSLILIVRSGDYIF